jgi:hypothetical protein
MGQSIFYIIQATKSLTFIFSPNVHVVAHCALLTVLAMSDLKYGKSPLKEGGS